MVTLPIDGRRRLISVEEGRALREHWANAYGDNRLTNETYTLWLRWIEEVSNKRVPMKTEEPVSQTKLPQLVRGVC